MPLTASCALSRKKAALGVSRLHDDAAEAWTDTFCFSDVALVPSFVWFVNKSYI